MVGMEQLSPVDKKISHKLKKRRFSHKKVENTKGAENVPKTKDKVVKSIAYKTSDLAVKGMNSFVSNTDALV